MPVLKCEFCKKSFIMNDFLQNPHFSAQNVLVPLLFLHMYFFIPKVFLKDQKMLNLKVSKSQNGFFFLAEDSPKKRTKTRPILVKTNSFVRFLGESSVDNLFSKLTDL